MPRQSRLDLGYGLPGVQQNPSQRPRKDFARVSLRNMSEDVPETDIRVFLRSRRARITPEQAGLPMLPGVRRVPGLRREEVAQLAGVSVEGLLLALQNIADIPALILGHRLDVLALNRLASSFYSDFDALPPEERNMARFMFLNDAARDLYVDWSETAREIVGMLHLYASHHPHDPLLSQLVGELSISDRDFRRWWADHDVYRPSFGTKRYRHPLVGELTLGFEAFTPRGDVDQTLGLYTVEPGSPSEHAFRMLASWTASSAHITSDEAAANAG
jgi:hypothetical protein